MSTTAGALVMGSMVTLAGPALGQAPLPAPPPYQTVDANGVDLISGALLVSGPSISIGDPQFGGLSNIVTYVGTGKTIGWRHSAFSGISRSPAVGVGAWYTVTVLGQSNVFVKNGDGGFRFLEGPGGTLTLGDGVYTFTASDGTITTFKDGQTTLWPFNANEAVALAIMHPNGLRIDYHYKSISSGGDTLYRPQSVTSNLGYQLHFEYQSDVFGPAFGYVTAVTALNNAVDPCDPLATTCTYSGTWPRLTISGNSATDSLGRMTRVSTDSLLHVVGIARPSQLIGFNDTVAWNNLTDQVATYSNGAGTWSYAFENAELATPPYVLSNTVTDPLAQVTSIDVSVEEPEIIGSDKIRPRIYRVTSPLTQKTDYGYDEGGRLTTVSAPEGDSIQVAYNYEGNLFSRGQNSKPGSNLAQATVTATYGDCSTPIRCRRPNRTTDVNGAVTDYTYDAAGNLLTVTGPAATPGAPRPQTRYVWEQRYAWYKQNGSSAITQAASPVWVQVSQSQCLTGATCP